MKKISIVVFILCLMAAGSLYADEQSHRKLAEELLTVMQVDKEVDATYDKIKAMHREQMKGMEVPQESLTYQDKMMDMMAQEMTWEKLKDDYITVYTEVFTEEELKGLIDFYKTPMGQKYVEKTPGLRMKLMQVGQKHSMQLMPKIKAMTTEMTNEMIRRSQGTTSNPPLVNAEIK